MEKPRKPPATKEQVPGPKPQTLS